MLGPPRGECFDTLLGFGVVLPVNLELTHSRCPLEITHTQASAAFPENTLASFERAIRDGAEAIESGESFAWLVACAMGY